MALSNDLISQFVKITKDDTKTVKESTVYGTVVQRIEDGRFYVQLDGSDVLTPVTTTTDMKNGERVTVKIKNHSATVTGNITSPSARTDDVKELDTEVTALTEVVADKVSTKELEAEIARINKLEADAITTDEFEAATGRIDILEANEVTINGKVSANEADINSLKAKDATIENRLTANEANINKLDANVADIDTLIFGSAAGDVIQTSFANAVIAQLGDAQIKSAMIEDISASKISAGDIITNNVHVKSEDGKLLISDETIQISDTTRVRVQIGKDSAGDYSINIWDANGKLMFSEGGITDNAIKEAIIRNDMVSDNANISASKLDINSLFTEINGSANTINSTKIYLDDEKQTLDVAFKSMTTDVDDMGDKITSQGTQISAIQGKIDSKVWLQDIDGASGELSTKYTELEQSIDGISATVASHTAELNRLDVSGRNLIVRRDELVDTYVIADGTILDCQTNYQSATMADYISIEGGETYTFSKDSSVSDKAFRWAWYDKDMTVLGRTYTNDNICSWTAPDSAAYLRVSYPYTDGANPKLEKGSEATEYSPALEDIGEALSDLKASIQVSADSITSTVSETYVTKTEFSDLEIGGTNLIKNSDFSNGTSKWVIGTAISAEVEEDSTYGQCLKMTSTVVGSATCRIYPSTTENFIHSGGTYSLSFYAKADANTTMQTNVGGSTEVFKDHSLSTSWRRYTHTYDAVGGSITFWPNEANTTIYITKVKVEHGDKCTDWTLAPEDVDEDIENVNTQVSNVDSKIVAAQSVIEQLSDAISMLVTDENGTTLLEQTSEGWTFNMASIQKSVDSASKGLDELSNDLGDVNNTVDTLKQAVENLDDIAEYVAIGTYQETPPHLHFETTYDGGSNYRIYYDTANWTHAANVTYTLSFRARSSTNDTVLVSCVGGQYNQNSYILNTEWKAYTTTYTTTTGGSLTFWLKEAGTDADIADLKIIRSDTGASYLAEDAASSADYWTSVGINVFNAVEGGNIEPCIELGESDSDFKLLITNTRIMFKEGSDIPTYINNRGLITENIEVKNEFRHGGFVWAIRTNGNYGLSWKGDET